MKIKISGIVDGKYLDKYGKRGVKNKYNIPTLSFPILITDEPSGTQSFCIVFDDPDSVSVCGFKWIHWLCVFDKNSLEENASILDDSLIQGLNSWGRLGYGGMAPPNAPHTYICKVYALDILPSITDGFSMDELEEVIENHMLEYAVVEGVYDN